LPQEVAAAAHTQAYWEARGWEVLGEEIEIRLSNGKFMYEDFLLRNKVTGDLILDNAKGAHPYRGGISLGKEQKANYEMLEEKGGTITGRLNKLRPGYWSSPEVQKEMTGYRFGPGTRVGISKWRASKGTTTVEQMEQPGGMERLKGSVDPMPIRQLSITNGIMGAISALGFIAAVHDYMAQSRLIDQGWSV